MSPPTLTLAECFRDFNERFPKTDQSGQRQLLGEFTGANQEQTINRWLSGKLQPGGEYKWRSIAFFSLLGYKIQLFEAAGYHYKRAIELLALDVITADKLAGEGFGFAGQEPKSRMYRVFENGETPLSPVRTVTLQNFIDQHVEDLTAAKQLFDEQYGAIKLAAVEISSQPESVVVIPTAQPAAAVRPLRPTASAVVRPKLSHDTILTSAANFAQGLLPLLELIASDAFSAAERAELRERAGGDGIFKLSNILENLCGERARNQSIKQGVKR